MKKGKTAGLRKWNKVFSIIIKDYKKSKIPYNIKDVRKESSEIYVLVKNISFLKLSARKIKEAKSKKVENAAGVGSFYIIILATQIPKNEIDKVGGWRFFELDGVLDFNNKFPEVPIVIKTPKNEFKINGNVGGYGGSDLSNFINNELRQEYGYKEKYNTIFESSVSIQEKHKLPYLLITPDDLSNKQLNRLIKEKVVFPKKVDRIVKKEIQKRIETEDVKKKRIKEEEKADKKRKKGKLPKAVKPLKIIKEKDEPKKGLTDIQSQELTKQLQLLRDDFKDGVYTKDEYKLEKDKLTNKYGKGGKIYK